MTSGRSLARGEAAMGAAVLALGLFVGFETARIEVGPSYAAVGPRLFPFLIALGLVLVGLALLREALTGKVAHREGLALDLVAVLIVAAALVIDLLLIERVGWVIAAAVLFVAVARAFGSRRLLADLAIGAALALLTFILFNYGLDLGLPGGALAELFAPAEQGEP